MEIERKFLISDIDFSLESFEMTEIEQMYLSTEPVVRIRKKGDKYYLTCKSKGMMERHEAEFSISKTVYEELKMQKQGNIIIKKRYIIPYETYSIELDIFEGKFLGLRLAEVEFASKEEAETFAMPDWFLKDVTFEKEYHNSNLAKVGTEEFQKFMNDSGYLNSRKIFK